MKPLSRKQAREALEQVPIDQVLSVPGELTHKQKEFARLVAMGETGAGAYRKAYKSKGTGKTQATQAHRIKSLPDVSRTIQAFQLANEAAKYQTPAQLRALVLHSLVQVIVDPEAKHATRVAAAKVLGTVTEVAAFTERRETRVIRSSEDAKAQVLAKLREVLRGSADDAQIADADALMLEITGEPSAQPDAIAPADDPAPDALAQAADPAPPTPRNAVWSPPITMHSNPHEPPVSKTVNVNSLESHIEPKEHSDLDISTVNVNTPLDEIVALEAELAGKTPPL